jgi:hypothetical protein
MKKDHGAQKGDPTPRKTNILGSSGGKKEGG